MPPVRQWPGERYRQPPHAWAPGRDHPPHRTRHSSPGHLCGHRRAAQRPYRYPGPATRHPWAGSAGRPPRLSRWPYRRSDAC